jgi:acetyl esterase/lipase
MIIFAYFLSFLSLILILSLLIHLKPPYNFFLAFSLQLAAVALSPLLVLLGLLGAVLGFNHHAPIAVAAGLMAAGISAIYIALVTVRQTGFDPAFGKEWKTKIPQSLESRMLKRRWNLVWQQTGEARWDRDLTFWIIPGTDRKLLCDVWQPLEGAYHSGLAFVFLHGGGWYIGDKDFATRLLFRHMVYQGHVVMDVAYRLCPEVDFYGMVSDVKHAVSWMKSNAARYQVSPDKVVLGGGSSGGHLALLAAYAPHHPLLTPPELEGIDLRVNAVVSYYGPTDLRACYHHLDQTRVIGMPKVEIGQPGAADMKKNFSDAGRLDILLGGHLNEVPEVYELASPVTHVNAECPPTLLIQGEPDVVQPVEATRELHRRLVDCGVPAVNIIFPLTNHAFDLLLPVVSPPAQAAHYYLDRFLALMV